MHCYLFYKQRCEIVSEAIVIRSRLELLWDLMPSFTAIAFVLRNYVNHLLQRGRFMLKKMEALGARHKY